MTGIDFQERRQNKAIQRYIASIPAVNKTNYYVTISFNKTNIGPLRRKNAPDVERMVKSFAKKLSSTLYGRERRYRKKRVTFIGWLEDKDKSGNDVPLHAHCLLYFPPYKFRLFTRITEEYWNKIVKNYYKSVPDIDIRSAYEPTVAAEYSGKNIESGLTLEYLVTEGLDLE